MAPPAFESRETLMANSGEDSKLVSDLADQGTPYFARELMPRSEKVGLALLEILKSYGYPLDPSAFEWRETLMEKYGEDSKSVSDLADLGIPYFGRELMPRSEKVGLAFPERLKSYGYALDPWAFGWIETLMGKYGLDSKSVADLGIPYFGRELMPRSEKVGLAFPERLKSYGYALDPWAFGWIETLMGKYGLDSKSVADLGIPYFGRELMPRSEKVGLAFPERLKSYGYALDPWAFGWIETLMGKYGLDSKSVADLGIPYFGRELMPRSEKVGLAFPERLKSYGYALDPWAFGWIETLMGKYGLDSKSVADLGIPYFGRELMPRSEKVGLAFPERLKSYGYALDPWAFGWIETLMGKYGLDSKSVSDLADLVLKIILDTVEKQQLYNLSSHSRQAIDLTTKLRGGGPATFLIVKCFADSYIELYNIRTAERFFIEEEGEIELVGFSLIASNHHGWVLMRRNRSMYYLNVENRRQIHLPDLNCDLSQNACGAFRYPPDDTSNRLVLLDLVVDVVTILEHRIHEGWYVHNFPANVGATYIDCLRLLPNRLYWVANDYLCCCSNDGPEWFIALEQHLDDFVYYSSSFVERGEELFLILLSEAVEVLRVFSITDFGNYGSVQEVVDGLPGVVYTVDTTGGHVFEPSFPFENQKLFCAGGLFDTIECLELCQFPFSSRVIRRCQVGSPCICNFAWFRRV